MLRCERGRDEELGIIADIFCGVVIKLTRWDDFTRHGCFQVVISENADLNLSRVETFLNNDFAVELGGERQRFG